MKRRILLSRFYYRTFCLLIGLMLCGTASWAEWERENYFTTEWVPSKGCIKVNLTYFTTYGANYDGHEGFLDFYNGFFLKMDNLLLMNGVIDEDGAFTVKEHLDGVTWESTSVKKPDDDDEYANVLHILIPIDGLGRKRIDLKGHWWRNGAVGDHDVNEFRICDVDVLLSPIKVESDDIYYSEGNSVADCRIYWKADLNKKRDDEYSHIELVNSQGLQLDTVIFPGIKTEGTFSFPISDKILNNEEVLNVQRTYKKEGIIVSNKTKVIRKSYPYPVAIDLDLNKDTRMAKVLVDLSAAPTMHTRLDPIHIAIDGFDEIQGEKISRAVDINPEVGKQKKYVAEFELPEHFDCQYKIVAGRKDVWNMSAWDKFRKTKQGHISLQHVYIDSASVNLNEDNTTATLKWSTEGSHWSKGSVLKIRRYANGSEVVDAEFSIAKEEEWKKGETVDRSMIPCNSYTYTFQVVPGGKYNPAHPFKAIAQLNPVTIGKIVDFQTSKGYFSKYVRLNWETEGAFDKFVVYRREYQPTGGSGEFRKVSGEIPIHSGSTSYSFDDTECFPGSFYEYRVEGLVHCASLDMDMFALSPDTCVGFRMPTGEVRGRVSFKNGQPVKNVEMRLTAEDYRKRGYSVKLDGKDGSFLRTSDQLCLESSDFSFQMFVRPDQSYRDSANWTAVLMHTDILTLSLENGVPCFILKDKKVKSKTILSDENFTQLSVSYSNKNRQILMVVDGKEFVKEILAEPIQINDDLLTLGQRFNGWIDEVRVWNCALSEVEIKNTYFRILTGQETGLVAYYRLNEPVVGHFYDFSSDENGHHERHGDFYGNVAYDDEMTPRESQLAYVNYTDERGDYTINDIPYYDEGTAYTLSPILDAHSFRHDNMVGPVTLNINGKRNVFEVNFLDVSSFRLSGYVYYAGGSVPVKGASFYVDHTVACDSTMMPILSDEQGAFAIDVPVGNHEVKVKKSGHNFANNGRLLRADGCVYNFQKDEADVHFYDSTKVRLIGRIAGGYIEYKKDLGCSLSENNLADDLNFVLKLKDLGGKIVKERADSIFYNVVNDSNEVIYSPEQVRIVLNNKTGEYVADLLPEVYEIVQMNIKGHPNVLGDKRPTIDLRDKFVKSYVVYPKDPNQGETQDSTYYNHTYSFRVDEKPKLIVEEINIPLLSEDAVYQGEGEAKDYFGSLYSKISTFDDNGIVNDSVPFFDINQGTYCFGKPIYEECKIYTFRMKAGMPFYYNGDSARVDWVPIVGGKINITNDIRKETDSLTLNREGMGIYQFAPNNPDLSLATAGIKDIQFALSVDNERVEPVKIEGYVLGGETMGADFITKGPSDLLFVLRDPPGTHSYSYINHLNLSMDNDFYVEAGELSGNGALIKIKGKGLHMAKGNFFFNIEKNAVWDFESHDGLTLRMALGGNYNFGTTVDVSMSKRLSTSDSPEFVGRNGDVFVGLSSNIEMGERKSICIKPIEYLAYAEDSVQISHSKKYVICKGDELSMSKEFKTAFAYPQVHIEQVIIPKMQEIINSLLERGKGLDEQSAMTKANKYNYAVYVPHADVIATENYGIPNTKTSWLKDKKVLKGDYYDIYYPEAAIKKDQSFLPTDSILAMDIERTNWEKMLAFNEAIEVSTINMQSKRNVSFQGGATVTANKKVHVNRDVTNTNDVQFTYGGSGAFNFDINNYGIRLKVGTHTNFHHNDKHTSSDGIDDEIGFVLSEVGADYMNVDIYEVKPSSFTLEEKDYVKFNPWENDTLENDFSSEFVYYLKGGVTSNPYEGVQKTRYYQSGKYLLSEGSLKVEVPHITVKPAVVANVPSTKPAVFRLTMYNQSEAHRSSWFTLRLVNGKEALASRIYIDGAPLGSGRDFLLGEENAMEKKLEIYCGDDDFEMNDIQFVLASKNQGNALSYNGVISDTISLSAFFIPSSTEVKINSPVNNWVLSQEAEMDSVLGKRFIPIKVDGFNTNSRWFDRIEVQYKPLHAKDWMKLRTFYKNSSDVKDPVKEEVIGDQTTLIAKFVGDIDQKYEIRAQSFSRYGDSKSGYKWVTYETAPLQGIKDMKSPRLFGRPQPADGILDVKDDLMFIFDEEISGGRLTPADITVTAVKNGVLDEHHVSVHLNGMNDRLTTAFEKDWKGKNLTIEFWMLMDDVEKESILFSHGHNLVIRKSAAKMEADGIHATGALQVNMEGMEVPLESQPLKWEKGVWSHVAVVLDQDHHELVIYFNGSMVGTTAIPTYNGVGKLLLGEGFAGNLDELRIWDKVIDAVDIRYNSNKKFSGAESSLMVYYPMNEAKGHVVQDKARGNHAELVGSWNSDPGYSLALTGNNALDINTGVAGVRADDHYTLDFWFKSDFYNDGNSTLFSTGLENVSDSISTGNLLIGFENHGLVVRSDGQLITTTGNYDDHNWHHLVFTVNRNGGYGQLYVDRQMLGYLDSENVVGLLSSSIYLGARGCLTDSAGGKPVFDRYFKGWIDEFRLWKTSFTLEGIQHMGNLKMTGREVGLVAYYPFEKWYRNPSNNMLEMEFTLKDMVEEEVAECIGEMIPSLDEHAPLVDKGVEESVRFDYLTNKEKLLIKLLDDEQSIDQTIVNVAVEGVCDINGNKMASPVTWSVFVNANPLRWGDSKKVIEMKHTDKVNFDLLLTNSTGVGHSFSLEGLPTWLTAAPLSGEVAPNGTQKIHFSINPGIRVGHYDERIYALSDSKVAAAIPLEVKVHGERPNWTVNPHAFASSVSIFGKMKFGSVFSEDEDDMIAVFRNGQCVGVGYSEYEKDAEMWFTYLTVYTDSLLSDGVNLLPLYEFRMWDASTGCIYGAEPSQPLIVNKSICGALNDLVVFCSSDKRYRDISIEKGWNWVSLGALERSDRSVNHTLRYGTWTDEDMIKGSTFFDSYSEDRNTWEGTLDSLHCSLMYMIKAKHPQKLSISGNDNVSQPIVVLGNHWNWIGYLPEVNMSVQDALVGFDAQEGDILKSQDQFAMYSDGKWTGSLRNMEVNRGYMLYSAKNGKFTYPRVDGIRRNARNSSSYLMNTPALRLHYPTNHTLIAFPVGTDVQPGDVIAAYINGEMRGLSEIVVVDGRPLHFISIAGDNEKDNVTFTLLRDGEPIVQSMMVMPFHSNAMNGTVKEPMGISFNSENDHVKVYPNPFVNYLHIEFYAEQSGEADIAIYDISGRLIWHKLVNAHVGKNKCTWTSSASQSVQCAGGVHMVRVQVNGKTSVHEVIKK